MDALAVVGAHLTFWSHNDLSYGPPSCPLKDESQKLICLGSTDSEYFVMIDENMLLN